LQNCRLTRLVYALMKINTNKKNKKDKLCRYRKFCPATHRTLLPPSKLSGIIPKPLPIYCGNFVKIAITVPRNVANKQNVTQLKTQATENSIFWDELNQSALKKINEKVKKKVFEGRQYYVLGGRNTYISVGKCSLVPCTCHTNETRYFSYTVNEKNSPINFLRSFCKCESI